MTETEKKSSELLLAMPLLLDMKIPEKSFIQRLSDYWKLKVEDVKVEEDKKSLSLTLDGIGVIMALVPGPIPKGEFDDFEKPLLWSDAKQEIEKHVAHIIVAVISSERPQIERYKVFTKFIESILHETNSIGLYQGSQTLLVKKEIYIDMAESLLDDVIPVMLWVYIGGGNDENGYNIYTYGLDCFDKLEMEIVGTKQDPDEVFDFFLNVVGYVIQDAVTFKEGETLGYTESIDARIEISKGVFLDGETIKIIFNEN